MNKQHVPFYRSLRWRVLAIFTVCAVAMVSVAVVLSVELGIIAARRRLRQHLAASLNSGTLVIDEWLETQSRSARALTDAPSVQAALKEANASPQRPYQPEAPVREVLANYVGIFQEVGNVLLIDQSGVVIADGAEGRFARFDLSGTDLWQRVRKSDKPVVVGGVATAAGSDHIEFPVAARAVSADGRFLGAVVIAVDWSEFVGQVRTLTGGEGAELLVLDETGKVMEAPDASMLVRPLPADHVVQQAPDTGVNRVKVDGKWQLVAVRRMDRTGWTVAVVRDESQVLGNILTIRWTTYLLGAAVLAVGFLALLASLTSATRALKHITRWLLAQTGENPGDESEPLDHSPVYQRRDELGILARSFVEMQQATREGIREVRESEQRLELVLKGASMGAWDWHLPSGTVVFDQRWAEMLGYELDELEPRLETWERLVHPEDREPVLRALAEHVEGNTTHFEAEHRLRHKDGRWVWILTKGKVIEKDEQGAPIRACGTHLDISDRKRAEQLLRENDERLRLALQAASMGTWEWEVETDRVTWSPETLRIVGVSSEEFGGTYESYRRLVAPEDRDGVDRIVREFLQRAEPQSVVVYEHGLVREDGRRVWVEVRGTLFTDADGRPVRMVGVCADITERKRHEMERQKLESRLRQAQKMEAVGQLAGGVAHDFNNILQAVLGYGQLAMREVQEDGTLRESIDEILKAGHRARTLVSQLLAFSRRQMLQMKYVDLNDVVADLMKMVRRVIGEHVELHFWPGEDLHTIRADRGQISQIVMNLCLNARDAMPEGGTIDIRTENVEIGQEYVEAHPWAAAGRYVCLSVTDTGTGMSEEVRSKAFEPFFTTKRTGKGTGLGLSTVYGLVKQHNGMIDVNSSVGEGTTVRIYFPAASGEAVSAGETESRLAAPEGSETVLLAEDDEMVRRLTTSILQRAGYSVISAADGLEAVEQFSRNHREIDLAVLDVVMPKLGGKQACERIREKAPQLPVIFASGYSEDVISPDHVLEEGVLLIQKPYEADELLHKIRESLERQREA